MSDHARKMLDELMGRNRNSAIGETKEWHWQDEEFCMFYLVKFCPHDLFVNTRADLGNCRKLHDDNAKQQYDEAPIANKRRYEDEFLRFCNNMINEVDRKIQKGKQRLQVKGESTPVAPPHVSRVQEQVDKLNERIKKLVSEAEQAGTRGDVDQAQDLMTMCDSLKVERDNLLKNGLLHEGGGGHRTSESSNNPHWTELAQAQEKQMEVCEVCGAFLIVGDAQQRIEDHLTGKQHLGYARLRKAVDEIYERRRKERNTSVEHLTAPEPKRSRRPDDRRRVPSQDDNYDRRRRNRDGSRRDRDRGRRNRDSEDRRRQTGGRSRSRSQ